MNISIVDFELIVPKIEWQLLPEIQISWSCFNFHDIYQIFVCSEWKFNFKNAANWIVVVQKSSQNFISPKEFSLSGQIIEGNNYKLHLTWDGVLSGAQLFDDIYSVYVWVFFYSKTFYWYSVHCTSWNGCRLITSQII